MNERRKKSLCLVLFLLCLFALPISVQAKDTVTKVTSKQYYKNNKQYSVISGKTKKGKTVWKYKTSQCTATELNSTGFKVKGSYVYMIDNTTYIKLKKQTGKVVYKKKFKSSYVGWSPSMYVDGSGNLYSIGYYSSRLVKFSPKGKVLWTSNIGRNYYWPYKITASGSKVTVYFENGKKAGQRGKVMINTKTGKISSYK